MCQSNVLPDWRPLSVFQSALTCCRRHKPGMRRLPHQFQGWRNPSCDVRFWKIHLLFPARQPRQQLRQGGSRRLRSGIMLLSPSHVFSTALTCVSNVVRALSKSQEHPLAPPHSKAKRETLLFRVGRFFSFARVARTPNLTRFYSDERASITSWTTKVSASSATPTSWATTRRWGRRTTSTRRSGPSGTLLISSMRSSKMSTGLSSKCSHTG